MTQTVMRMDDNWLHDHWTEADLAALPEDGTRYEIIDGRLYVTPPAGESHQNLAGKLYALLLDAAPPGFRVLYEIGLKIGEQRLVPDIVVLPPDTPKADHDYNDVAIVQPVLVVEVASKSTEINDSGNKLIAYAQGGIPSYWRVGRDGTIHLHQLLTGDHYWLVGVVKPGTEHNVAAPFRMTLDPARLSA